MSLMKAAQDSPDLLGGRVEELRAELVSAEPGTLAFRTGATYTDKFRLKLWSRPVLVTFPELVARDEDSGGKLGEMEQALLAYYFHTSDGAPPSGRWISYSELPNGRFYANAFQGYSGNQLLKTFGNDSEACARAATGIGGWPCSFGDKAFSFQALPQVPLLLVCWLGDEDFSASYRILFDATISHHLPTDVCAILGSMLTRRLIKAHLSSVYIKEE